MNDGDTEPLSDAGSSSELAASAIRVEGLTKAFGAVIAGQVAAARRELRVGVLDALDPAERPIVIDAMGRIAASTRHATARTTPSQSTRQGWAS